MGGMPPEPRLRADAQKNRELLVRAAIEVFTVDGFDAPLEDVARAAGVGIGTLYRRFPDRTALIVGVVRESLTTLVAEVGAAIREQPDSWSVLTHALPRPGEFSVSMRSILSLPQSVRVAVGRDPNIVGLRRQLSDQIEGVVTRAQAEGSLRPDIGSGDVLRLFGLLTLAKRRTPEEVAAADRIGLIVLDGLRSGATSELPGTAASAEEIVRR